ncbi:MAG TPA: hypothetical protein VLB68_32870, partial [Pyrinomonadaceae bacterium]|nr:hypothetical protein [Pyrinomonadaceae bacterium]
MKRKLLLLSLLLCLVLPVNLASGAPNQQTAAKPAQTRQTAVASSPTKIPEAKIISQQLPNGLEVIVMEDHSIPLVTIEL